MLHIQLSGFEYIDNDIMTLKDIHAYCFKAVEVAPRNFVALAQVRLILSVLYESHYHNQLCAAWIAAEAVS